MHSKLFFAISACFTLFYAQAQTDSGQKNNTKVIQVQDNIYMLQGQGGNIGFSVGDDGVFMIDDQFADATEDILKDIKRISKEPITFLVNTHAHGDHTGGNANLAKEGALIVAHEGVRNTLEEKRNNVTDERSGKVDKTSFPIVTFKDDITFYQNGDRIMVFHVDAAHTDGDAIVFFTNSNVIHMGDVFFNNAYPYIDLKNGGTLKGYIAALDKVAILANNETKFIPGHGDIGNLQAVKDASAMLKGLHRKVTFHYMNGKSETEIIAMRDFTKPYDDIGFGDKYINTQKILKTIYDEVKKERGPIDRRTMAEKKRDLEKKYGKKEREPRPKYVPTEAEKKEMEAKKKLLKDGDGGN